jgi:hypothetical protein
MYLLLLLLFQSSLLNLDSPVYTVREQASRGLNTPIVIFINQQYTDAEAKYRLETVKHRWFKRLEYFVFNKYKQSYYKYFLTNKFSYISREELFFDIREHQADFREAYQLKPSNIVYGGYAFSWGGKYLCQRDFYDFEKFQKRVYIRRGFERLAEKGR